MTQAFTENTESSERFPICIPNEWHFYPILSHQKKTQEYLVIPTENNRSSIYHLDEYKVEEQRCISIYGKRIIIIVECWAKIISEKSVFFCIDTFSGIREFIIELPNEWFCSSVYLSRNTIAKYFRTYRFEKIAKKDLVFYNKDNINNPVIPTATSVLDYYENKNINLFENIV